MGVQKYFPGERVGGFYTDESETFTSAGYVVKISGQSTDYVTKAERTDAWFGVNAKSTEDPLNEGSFLSGTAANVPVVTDGIVRARATSNSVSAGQPLVVLSGGEVSGLGANTTEILSAGYVLVGHSVGDASDNFIDVKLL